LDYVLANPPFGKKSSMTFTNEEGEQEKEDLDYNRQDFWATTSNKQLNFVQHIRSMLKIGGTRRRGAAGQRALRGRRRRNRAQGTAGDRAAHHPAPAHGHLLRPGREGQRALLRQRFKFFSYEDLVARDKASLDLFWLKDDSLDNLDDLPPPDVLQQEIIEHLEAALAAFRDVALALPRTPSQ
jgi:type I restriction enzyme M protein